MSLKLWDSLSVGLRRYSTHDHFGGIKIMDDHLTNVTERPCLRSKAAWTGISALPGISYMSCLTCTRKMVTIIYLVRLLGGLNDSIWKLLEHCQAQSRCICKCLQGTLASLLPLGNLLVSLLFLAACVICCPNHIFGDFVLVNGTLHCASLSPTQVSPSCPHTYQIVEGRGSDQPFLNPSRAPSSTELVKSLTSGLWEKQVKMTLLCKT